MVGDFSRAIVTIHNFYSLQDLPALQDLYKMHYEAKEYASPPRTHHTQKMWRESLRYNASRPRPCPSVVVSVFDDQ